MNCGIRYYASTLIVDQHPEQAVFPDPDQDASPGRRMRREAVPGRTAPSSSPSTNALRSDEPAGQRRGQGEDDAGRGVQPVDGQ